MNHVLHGKAVLDIEAAALEHVAGKLDENFSRAVDLLLATPGRVVVCGMGKSGYIARKIVATLISTGTPSIFLHPAEALHGDLGAVLPGEVFMMISNSGETDELVRLVSFARQNDNRIIVLTGSVESSLGIVGDITIDVGVEQEACPLSLAPTASTTSCLAVGDAIAVCLMTARGFNAQSFARLHPGGSLGRHLLGVVSDFATPAVKVEAAESFNNVLIAMTKSDSGIICVIENDQLVGVITDGDIRRALTTHMRDDLFELESQQIMSSKPVTVSENTKCSDADEMMLKRGVNSLVVTGSEGFKVYHNINKRVG